MTHPYAIVADDLRHKVSHLAVFGDAVTDAIEGNEVYRVIQVLEDSAEVLEKWARLRGGEDFVVRRQLERSIGQLRCEQIANEPSDDSDGKH